MTDTKGAITPETQTSILEAAWDLISRDGSALPGMAEIARAAGVTRQSVYLAFGSRAGLLVAMARHADARSQHSRRMSAMASDPEPSAETFLEFVDAWLHHLPEVFPVGRILVAAAATDPDAAAVLQDRMEGSLHATYLELLLSIEVQELLHKSLTAETAADITWSLTHLDAWRHLVVERGWSPNAFRENRIEILRRCVLR